jgi:hypothetical protein
VRVGFAGTFNRPNRDLPVAGALFSSNATGDPRRKSSAVAARTTFIGLPAVVFLLFAASGSRMAAAPSSSHSAMTGSESERSYYANAHPYLEEPLKSLIKRVPQLKGLRPAATQQELPIILQKTGAKVDDFFRNIIDLTAREEISLARLRQEQPYTRPELAGENVRDNYLILRHGNTDRMDIVEYRMDAKGDNFDQVVIKQGFLVTSGFALSCNYFSSGFQSESTFRYLGDEKIGPQDVYVVGFAQQPGKATLSVTMRGRSGTPSHLLVQGIAWINKSNFQIVQMRTDLLAPRHDVGLNQQTTQVTLSKVKLIDVATPLWLPSNVKVFVEFTTHNGEVDEFYELSYRNEHHYSDYQRYRVSSKVIP